MQPASYITTLTPLRGIAAILVLLFHSGIFLYPVAPRTCTFLQNGWLWVDFFFVLSGFIMSHVYGGKFRQRVDRKSYKHYLQARFARVYPLHLITLCWALAAGMRLLHQNAPDLWKFFFKNVFDHKAIPTSLLLLQSMNFHSTAPLNTVSWSLSTEWWMYVLFPFLVAPLYRSKKGGRIVLLLFVAALYTVLKYYLVPVFGRHLGQHMTTTINTINDLAFFRCMAGFLLGMWTYELYRQRIGYAWMRKSYWFVISFAGVLAALYADLNELLVVALFSPVILTAAYNTTAVKRIMDGDPLQRLGDWSFSIYMVHVPILFTWRALAPVMGITAPDGFITQQPVYTVGILYCTALLTLTLITASFFYRYVEVPARNYLNRQFQMRPYAAT